MALTMETRTGIKREVANEAARQNGFRIVLSETGGRLEFYEEDFNDILVSISAEGGDRAIDDFFKAYEVGLEHGKRAKAHEIRHALDC